MGDIARVIDSGPETKTRYVVTSLDQHLDEANLSPLPKRYYGLPNDERYLWNNQEREYLNSQIEEYLDREHIDRNREWSFEFILSLAANFLWAGTGEFVRDYSHDKRNSPLSVFFNLLQKPGTHCVVFNTLYLRVYECLCAKYNPKLLELHQIGTIGSYHALDLARHTDVEPVGNFISFRTHEYCLLFSNRNGEIIITPIDPYHTEDNLMEDQVMQLDKSATRATDAVREAINLTSLTNFERETREYHRLVLHILDDSTPEVVLNNVALYLFIVPELKSSLRYYDPQVAVDSNIAAEIRQSLQPEAFVEDQPQIDPLDDNALYKDRFNEVETRGKITDYLHTTEQRLNEELRLQHELHAAVSDIKSIAELAIDRFLDSDTRSLAAVRALADVMEYSAIVGLELDPLTWVRVNQFLIEGRQSEAWRNEIEEPTNRVLRRRFTDSFVFSDQLTEAEMQLYIEYKVNYFMMLATWDIQQSLETIKGDKDNLNFMIFLKKLIGELRAAQYKEEADYLTKNFEL